MRSLNLDQLRALAAVVEHGGFTAAAKRLSLSQSAVSTQIKELEERLGVRLVDRIGKKAFATALGRQVIERARQLLATAESLENEVSASAGQPQGLLRISGGVAFGLSILAPAIVDFQRLHPSVEVVLSTTDRLVDLHAEGVDIALRTGPQRDPTLMATKVADMRRIICASPDYIARRGMPETPADLAGHDCILYTTVPDGGRWPFRTASGEIEHVPVTGRVSVDNAECASRLALMGAGIVRIADFTVAKAIQEGQLVPVLPDFHHAEVLPCWVVCPPGARTTARVRVFIDFLVERFAAAAVPLEG